MAIVSKPKPTVHHKKRRAQHHRHSKLYLKPYWPYLPMVAIIGVGAVINQALYGVSLGSATGWLAASAPLAPTRIDVLTGQTGWGLVLIAVTAVAALVFAAMHWYRFHRFLNRGEAFVLRHPWFDISLVAILTAGFVLTRSA